MRTVVLAVTMWFVTGGLAVPAAAQEQQSQGSVTVSEVLSFLLTNQAVQTGDFEKDAEAAATTRDTITRLLLVELTSLPLGSSSAGFTYRVNPTLGTVERTSASFGPFFAERALTAGRGQFSLGANVQFARYTRLNDIDLESGAFLTTANQFRDEPEPFDVERLTLEIASQTFTILGNVGVTDRLDVGVAVPIVSLSLEGSRVNTYRGEQLLQASGFADANGLGDMALRAKLRLVGDPGAALAVLGEVRLPTGSEENLLGSGEASFTALLIGSAEPGRLGLHANAGYSGGGLYDELSYRGAVSFAASSRVTILGELLGRRIDGVGLLGEARAPHPTLADVDTIRLVSTDDTVNRNQLTAGVRWNVGGSWLVNGSVSIPVEHRGLRSELTAMVGLEYAFVR